MKNLVRDFDDDDRRFYLLMRGLLDGLSRDDRRKKKHPAFVEGVAIQKAMVDWMESQEICPTAAIGDLLMLTGLLHGICCIDKLDGTFEKMACQQLKQWAGIARSARLFCEGGQSDADPSR